METPRKTARTRTLARQERRRQESPALAALLSVVTVVLVCVVLLTILINIPGTALSNFWLLNQASGGVSPGSDLYQQFFAEIERQEVFFLSPVSLLCGGLVLGRLTPRRIPRARLLTVASGVAVGILLAVIALRWGLILYGQHGHLVAGELDTQLVLTQLACSLGWIVAYMAGVWIGVLWRDAGRRVQSPLPADPPLSRIPR